MTRSHTTIFTSLTVAVLLAATAHGGDFALSWHTIDGGGGTSAGGNFELSGTIGQPDAGAVMTGGEFELAGGFWCAAGEMTPLCPADIDGDGEVGFSDIIAVLSAWGNAGGPEDLDGSGFVDFGDLLIVLAAWGACP